MKTIGIIGGIGPDATIECYSYMMDHAREDVQRTGDWTRYPEVVIYSMGREDLSGTAFGDPDKPAKVRAVIERLHHAGADFCIGACNTLHIVHDEVVRQGIPIPWISIMDATAEAITEAGLTKVGLTGTWLTMTHGFFHHALSRHGIEAISPDDASMSRIDEIISTELIWNRMTEPSRDYLLRCIDALVKRGAQGVILGCTELPLLVKQEHTAVRMFATTTILAQKALEVARNDEI